MEEKKNVRGILLTDEENFQHRLMQRILDDTKAKF